MTFDEHWEKESAKYAGYGEHVIRAARDAAKNAWDSYHDAHIPPRIRLEDAFHIALEVHGTQLDKAGKPYMFHLVRVAMQMDDDYERAEALLHDSVEDSPATIRHVVLNKIRKCLGGRVADTVAVLTH